jgi:hypothetical protein
MNGSPNNFFQHTTNSESQFENKSEKNNIKTRNRNKFDGKLFEIRKNFSFKYHFFNLLDEDLPPLPPRVYKVRFDNLKIKILLLNK